MAKQGVEPAEVSLTLAVIADAARALGHHEDRATVMRDRRALAFLSGSGRVGVRAMAEAAGVSEAAVKWELIRARKLPSIHPDRPTHLLATARASETFCGLDVGDEGAVPQILAAHARLHDYPHGECRECYERAGVRAFCPTCGEAVVPPSVRCCCPRCGHKLAVHTAGLDCGVCGEECGLDATASILR